MDRAPSLRKSAVSSSLNGMLFESLLVIDVFDNMVASSLGLQPQVNTSFVSVLSGKVSGSIFGKA